MWTLWLIVAFAAPSAEQAAQALKDGDFATAARGWAAVTRTSSDQGDAWFQLATAEMGRQRFTQAADAWGRAADLKYRAGPATYNRACALARAGKADEALAALEQAVTLGMTNGASFATDPDLVSIVGMPKFATIVELADTAARPCLHDPRYDALDYWVGAFTVAVGPQTIGTNLITREQQGCVLVERWTSGLGGTGTSFSFRDPGRDVWRQLWIDSTGNLAEYEGTFDRPGHLVMEARTVGIGGTEGRSRGTWAALDDGTVRQTFESQNPDGTWTVTFDAIYTRT